MFFVFFLEIGDNVPFSFIIIFKFHHSGIFAL